MNRELRRAIRRRCREVLESELPWETFLYLADRKGFDLPDGSHFGGFSATDERWKEVDAVVKDFYTKAMRGGP